MLMDAHKACQAGLSVTQGEFVLGNLSEKSTIAVFIEVLPIKGLCREQIYRGR
jgi:hypothetical protein